MKTILNDLLGMLICSGVLYAVYVALLDRRIPLRGCRAWLLGVPAAAVVIPLLQIPVWPGPVLTASPMIAVGAMEATFEVVGDPAADRWSLLLGAIYAAGAVVVLIPLVRQLLQVHSYARGAQITRTEDYRLVRTPQPVEACSFFRSIYIRHDTPDDELPLILLHETSHIRHGHSAERIVMELMKALLWWNPFVWLLAGRLREVEEYEADRDVLRSGCDREQYMQLILKQLLGYSPDITNGLRNSLTKKRFFMMTTNHPHRHVLLRLAGAVPAVTGLLCAFSFTTRAAVYEVPEAAASERPPYAVHEIAATDTLRYDATIEYPADPQPAAAPEVRSDDEPLLRTEVMPKFRGGNLNDFRQWAQEQVRYPQAAREQQIQGRVAASFVIEKDGRLTSVQVLASPDRSLSDEAVRVLQSSERWEPGRNAEGAAVRVKYTLPIDFRLVPAPEDAPVSSPKQQPATGSENLYVRTEQMPRYQGGDLNDFRRWAQLQIRYPQEAKEQGVQGMVVASFVVDREGSVDAIEVLKSPSEMLANEVIRVLKRSERWEPGRDAAGETVRVKYTLPIYFGISDAQEEMNPLAEARKEAETTRKVSQQGEIQIDPMVVLTYGQK